MRSSIGVLLLCCMLLTAAHAEPFNVDIELPDNYRSVEPGTEIWFTSKLLNLANQDRIDVTITYEVVEGERVLFAKSKTVAIETQASFVANMNAPREQGDYELRVTVFSPDGQSTAKTSFSVVQSKQMTMLLYAGLGVLLLAGLVLAAYLSRETLKGLLLRMKIFFLVKKRMKK